ncbi:FecR domain-containing protein [Novosphingobium lentum]|uniref:FecR domain-containing protein n=1 Tax=Novosphingobium lentum TaxID=145287 RepID=UPI000834AB48|nr:FecR domain-containing protein [Novosphingobium lentum]
MRLRLSLPIGTVLAGLALLYPASAQAGVAPLRTAAVQRSGDETLRYVMARGDNLYTLAQRYFLKPGDFAVVQRINHVRNVHAVPVGTSLVIPLAILRGEPLTATIVALRGDVLVMQDGARREVRQGTTIGTGGTIETGTTGFVTVELPNGSRTSLPTRSRLAIRALRRILLTDGIDYDFEVSAGKAETEATHIAPGKGLFRIRTPRAVSAVRGTRFRVGYDDDQSATEVLDGTVAAGAGNDLTASIPKGFGATISRTGTLAKEQLLPAPDLIAPGKVQVDPLVTLAFAPVGQAKAYHVQIAADAGFVEVLAETTANGPLASFADIANGNWYVRASAIAQSGLEGLPQTYALRRALTGLSASAEGDPSAMRFKWSGAGDGRRIYRFQLARGSETALPTFDEPGLGPEGLVLHDLAPGTYFWRVGVRRFAGDGMTENWLPFEKLIVAAPEK